MDPTTSFEDKVLIKSAIDYSYRISRFDIHRDPIASTNKRLSKDFKDRYEIELVENTPIKRFDAISGKNKKINLRYILLKDLTSTPYEYALIFQGSNSEDIQIFTGEGDWSNNLSNAVHLEVEAYETAKEEFEYLTKARKYNITAAAGNSLGGGLALSLADLDENLRIVAVNPSPPQYGAKFKNSKYAIIVNTSKDALTRALALDVMRYDSSDRNQLLECLNDGSEDAVSKYLNLKNNLEYGIKDFYGVDNLTIERDLEYIEDVYFEASHRGVILEPRRVANQIFKDNLVHYARHHSEKFLDITKEKFSEESGFLKSLGRFVTDLNSAYFVDHYIEPVLEPLHLQKYRDIQEQTSLDDFIALDLISDGLINPQGEPYMNSVTDSPLDINKMMEIFTKRKFNMLSPLNRLMGDMKLEKITHTTENDLSKKITFFNDSFDLAIDLDIDIYDLIKNVPIPIISKLRLIKDQITEFSHQLSDNLNEIFGLEVSPKQIDATEEYRDFYQQQTLLLNSYVNLIFVNIEVLIENVEEIQSHSIIELPILKKYQIRQMEKKLKPLDFPVFQELDFDHSLVAKQRKLVSQVINRYKEDELDSIVENAETIVDLANTALGYLNTELEADPSKNKFNLAEQLKALGHNIDFPSLIINFLDVYHDDLVTLTLRDTIAHRIHVYYNLTINAGEQLIVQLLNLKHHLSLQDSEKYRIILTQIDEIITKINELNELIKKSK